MEAEKTQHYLEVSKSYTIMISVLYVLVIILFRKRKNIATLLVNYACTKMIDASVLLYFSFDSSFSQSRSMGQAVPTVHLTFYRLAAVIRDMSDIYRCSDHSLLPSQPLYTQ